MRSPKYGTRGLLPILTHLRRGRGSHLQNRPHRSTKATPARSIQASDASQNTLLAHAHFVSPASDEDNEAQVRFHAGSAAAWPSSAPPGTQF